MSQAFRGIADVARAVLDDPPAGDDPVVRFASPEALSAAFAEALSIELPEVVSPASADALAAAAELVRRYSVQTGHPRFMNQNFAGPDPVAVAGDWLGAALNTTNATYEAAPVFTLMERAVLTKLAGLAGYAPTGGLAPGLFCAGGSLAALMALQLARQRVEPHVVTAGSSGAPLMLFVSKAGHYSAVKSAALLGLGTNAVVGVSTHPSGAMNISALEEAIKLSRRLGNQPFAVIATAGTTVTAAFDDLEAVADLCEANDLWMHVDGCYGGSALFSAAQRHRLAGIERSDSFVWNLHKMMGMTQQCTALLVKDPAQLSPVFATGADYIFQPDKKYGELDAGDATFQCGRRVDVLKLWLAWHASGDAGFAARVDHAVAMADHARAVIEASDELHAVVPGDFTNVCFTWVPPELRPLDLGQLVGKRHRQLHAVPPRIKARMQAEGSAMLGFQPLHGINVFRLIVMNPTVTTADIDAVLAEISRGVDP